MATTNNTINKVDIGPVKEQRKLFGTILIPQVIATLLSLVIQGYIFIWAVIKAYEIRTIPLKEYGMLIHEFDPWFNFRATQYMSKHGWSAFFSWFDYMSWYPLGRPVGTTTYPGLQFTAVAIHRGLRWLGGEWKMSLNDVCCTIPAWGGAAATVFLTLITYEATGSRTSAVIAAALFAIIPGHLMRSMGGGFDNECIAMTAMLMTFYFWVLSLRNERMYWIGIIAGIAYGYMVAAWGGFTFVINMISLHAFICALTDMARSKYSPGLHKSYTLFFIVGTYLATCVPPVGLNPFKSLEQLSALFVFLMLQVLHLGELERQRQNVEILSRKDIAIKVRYFGIAGAVGLAVIIALYPTGWFGPLSSRVRGLFLKHTRTGKPLVDSVAEHQPASSDAYWQYLHIGYYGWMLSIVIYPFILNKGKAVLFLLIYSVVAYYFCMKMARLLLLASLVASAGTGLVAGFFVDWFVRQFFYNESEEPQPPLPRVEKKSASKDPKKSRSSQQDVTISEYIAQAKTVYRQNRRGRQAAALAMAAMILALGSPLVYTFSTHCERLAYAFSSPKIVFKSQQNDGSVITVNDYLDSYRWLRDHTPEDARVMAWWDYGYQITGIGNRTTIADGNTWNHEHIATLGKCLTSPVKEAHSLIRHLADYVLVWAGGRGDDLMKSPHMARIGNSVYRDICPNDPTCSQFGFYENDFQKPTPMMSKSLLYNLHSSDIIPGVKIDPKLFREVYKSRYGLVRIFQVMNVSVESKNWIADPENRKCDYPGSWYCPGQFPPAPAIQEMLSKRIDFAQLEDFNRKSKDTKYHSEYMKKMERRG